jgi:hypothetical protein
MVFPLTNNALTSSEPKFQSDLRESRGTDLATERGLEVSAG